MPNDLIRPNFVANKPVKQRIIYIYMGGLTLWTINNNHQAHVCILPLGPRLQIEEALEQSLQDLIPFSS